MKPLVTFLSAICLFITSACVADQRDWDTDVVVYGDASGGVTAAVPDTRTIATASSVAEARAKTPLVES